MKEELLHYVWKMKRFNFQNLTTTDSHRIVIKDFGTHNHNAGPDFLNAKVIIGDTLWIGHIEMHVSASEWYLHKHNMDQAYDNVILHAVYDFDLEVKNTKNYSVPALELKGRIDSQLIDNYEKLSRSLDWIPCAPQLHKLNHEKAMIFLQGVFIERLARKSLNIKRLLDLHKQDWESVLYILLLKYMGMKVNGEAFEMLAQVLPYSLLKKYSDKPTSLEALFLGQAGLLSVDDAYIELLKKEYIYLAKKHNLIPMTGVEWRFLRLRPANFPTLRMAQMAALIHKSPRLFSHIIHCNNIRDLEGTFGVYASTYWETHYLPGRTSPLKQKTIGASTRKSLLINVIAPLIFSYAKETDNIELRERAIELLYDVTSETNSIIKRWREHGIAVANAATSQALIELKLNYCDQYHCLKCNIGQQLIFT